MGGGLDFFGGGVLGGGPNGGGFQDALGFNQQNPVTQGMGIGMGPNTVGAWTTPGLQQGTAFEGDYNMQGPGSAEQYYAAAAPFYGQQGFGDQYWQQNQGRIQGGPQGLTSNAQTAFNQGLQTSADMSPYYDRAKERAVSDVDKSFASRGMFGSSAATGQVGQTVADLEAQRSRDEAQYGLQRAGMLGSLGSGADASNLGNAGMDLSYLQGGANMAGMFDQNALNRVNSGMNAAVGAQDARRTRVQDMFGNTSMPAMAMFGMQQQYLPQMMATDQALMDSSILFGTGLAQDMVNSDRYATEKDRADADMAAGLMGKFFGMGGM